MGREPHLAGRFDDMAGGLCRPFCAARDRRSARWEGRAREDAAHSRKKQHQGRSNRRRPKPRRHPARVRLVPDHAPSLRQIAAMTCQPAISPSTVATAGLAHRFGLADDGFRGFGIFAPSAPSAVQPSCFWSMREQRLAQLQHALGRARRLTDIS